MCLYFYLSFCSSVYVHVFIPVRVSFPMSVCLTFCFSILLSVCLSICLFFYMLVRLSVCPSFYLCPLVRLSFYLSPPPTFCLYVSFVLLHVSSSVCPSCQFSSSVYLSFSPSNCLSFCLSILLSFSLRYPHLVKKSVNTQSCWKL